MLLESRGATQRNSAITKKQRKPRRNITKELKREEVQMLLGGQFVSSVSKNLGRENTNLLYRWKADLI